MTENSADGLAYRDTTTGDLHTLADFGQKYLDAGWDEAFLGWKYFKNPAGRFYGCCAESGGQALGFYGNIPVRLKLGRETALGAQAVDLAVSPEARRHGLFVKMAQRTYQQMDQDGVRLDYAFPNPASQAGFVKRLDWTPVGLAPRYVKILDPSAMNPTKNASGMAARALARALAIWPQKRPSGIATGVEVHLASNFDERADRLWEQASADFPIAVKREAAYLNWRYVDNPQKQYQILIAERQAGLTGYCVLSYKDKTSQRAAALVELLVAPGEAAAGLALLAQATAQAREAGCAQMWCWMLPQHTFYTRLLRQSGFHYLANRFAPGFLRYTTPFIIRTLPDYKFQIDPAQLGNWFISMGDHDYY